MFARERRVEGPNNPLHWYGPIGELPDFFPDARTWTRRELRWGTRDDARTEVTCEPTGALDCDGNPIVVEHPLDCGLWRVSTYGASALRTATGGFSLNYAQMQGVEALPAGTALVDRPLPLWVEIGSVPSNKRRVRIDAGQTIFIYGGGINVYTWMPGPENPAGASWIDLGPSTGHIPITQFETLAVEGILYCEISRVESQRDQGELYATLTETYFVDEGIEPGLTRPVPIPPGARQLYVARDNTGVVIATRLQLAFSNGTTATQPLTAVPINDSQSAFSPQQLAYATHVLLPILAEPVLWTLCWEIAP